MKLLICGNRKIYSFDLPKKVENFYIINFFYEDSSKEYNKVITLKAINNQWTISSDGIIQLKQNGSVINLVSLTENISFEIKYPDLKNYIKVYIAKDIEDYLDYSINSLEIISVGSNSNSNIYIPTIYNDSVNFIKNGYECYIKKIYTNSNDIYLNSFDFGEKKLSIGDVIFVAGIHIIYMGDYLKINEYPELRVNNLTKIPKVNNGIVTNIVPPTDSEKNVTLFSYDQVFVHSPRLKLELSNEEIKLDTPPNKEVVEKTPAIFTYGSSALMLLTSSTNLVSTMQQYLKGTSDMLTLLPQLITFGAMFITSLFLPFLMEKWQKMIILKKERLRKKKYTQYLNEVSNKLDEIVKNQSNILKSNNTSYNQMISNIKSNSNEIWNREVWDNDFLTITVGIGNIPAKISLEQIPKKFSLENDELLDEAIKLSNRKLELENVPITFSLKNEKIMPIVITSNFEQDFIKSLVFQLIYYHSGTELKLVTITSEENSDRWEFIKYLPHSWDNKHEKRFFAQNEEELMNLSIFIEQSFAKYKEDGNSEENSKDEISNEYYVIVTDNFKLARDLPIVNRLLYTTNRYPMSLIIFEKTLNNMPSKFNSLITITNEDAYIIKRDTTIGDRIKFTPTYIENFDIRPYSNFISNIPVNMKGSDSQIPTHLKFLDMFYASRVDQLNILNRWKSNDPTISLRSVIGFKENDRPVELDLHEKFHGPHGLIAGSTGSGKSEFIISYILSMAVNYHPYEVQFVLIDYKGGGLAGAFENKETGVKLPHLIGTITNLDISEMKRTLVSINSELKRRQRVFNEARDKLNEGTVDIYKYQRFYREKKVKEPMSHLFIIADEFAELKAQQPEFMDELVSTARIGRSLGVHLILATQKPSGVVDDQIWSNTRFRVCLKVQTTGDSQEMLKNTDAAYIKQAGRFYLQVGNEEIYELAQSGWAGAKYTPTATITKNENDGIYFLDNSGNILKTINTAVEVSQANDNGEQLPNIVRYLANLAKKENIIPGRLWLPNIPENIYYSDIIKKYSIKSIPYYINPVIGEYDDPSNQKQSYVSIPLTECGNTFIVGTSGSGRSTLLSTLIYSLIVNHNSKEVNIYAVDLGAEKLKLFANAPQIGEILTSEDNDRIKFLFYMLNEEKNRRFSYYSKNGGDFNSDVKKKCCPFPTIVFIINEIDIFRENFEDLYDYEFASFTRNCNKVGIILIVTSTSIGALGYMVENNFPKKIVLNVTDETAFYDAFQTNIVPKKNAGRGIIEIDENPYEFQTSLIFQEDDYSKKLKIVIEQLNKYLKDKASSVSIIPEDITPKLLIRDEVTIENVPIGINLKTAQPYSYNFEDFLNIISSPNYASAKKFFNKFFEILRTIYDYKIVVINSIEDIKIEQIDEIKCYSSGFINILNTLNKNVEKLKNEVSEKKYLIVFIGYDNLENQLKKEKEEKDEIITINDLIINAKSVNNFKFILYDSERNIARIEEEEMDKYFKRNNGIWLGKDGNSQEIFETNNYIRSDSLKNDNAIVIKKGNYEILKF